MYTRNDFMEYVRTQRGTGRTTKMIDKVAEFVNEDPQNNVPQIVVLKHQDAKLIEKMLLDRGVEKFDIIVSEDHRLLFGRETTATFCEHTVAEYNLYNALSIYEDQIKDSQ